MASWIKNNVYYYFDIIGDEACLNEIAFKQDKRPKKIEIPSEVQNNGKMYPVTKLKGRIYSRPKKEQVTDKRRKDYGSYVNIPGQYDEFEVSILASKVSYDGERYDDTVEEVVLPKTIREIGEHSFRRCKKLKSITLNKGLEIIGRRAFFGCYNLKEIVIPASVKKIGYACFAGASVSIKIKNNPGTVEFENEAVGSDDNVTYLGESFLSKIFK